LGEITDALRRAGSKIEFEPPRRKPGGTFHRVLKKIATPSAGSGPVRSSPKQRASRSEVPEVSQDSLALRDLFWMVYKRRVLVASTLAFCVVTVTLGSFLVTPIYEARSSILIKFGRESVYRPEIGEREAMARQDRETLVNSELEILRSQALVADVVQSVGIGALYPDLAADPPEHAPLIQIASNRFAAAYSVQAVKDTDVIHLSFRHPDPSVGANAMSLLVDRFKEKHLEAHSEPQLTDFLEEQVAVYRVQLDDAEDGIRMFESKHPYFSVESPWEMLIQRRETLEMSLKDVEDQVATVRSRLAEENPALARIKTELVELQLEEKALLGTYLETSKPVVNIRKEIRRVSEFLSEQESSQKRSEFMDLRSLEERKVGIRREIEEVERNLRELPLLGRQHRNLARERDSQEENYQIYFKKLEEARLSQAMDQQKIANISIIQKAVASARPVFPRKKVNVALSMFFGLGLGVLAAYVLESISTKPT
jgi:uncharacterized protein involved in exopolysaccharide biosynthesis